MKLARIELTRNSQVASRSTPGVGMSLRLSCISIRCRWVHLGEWCASREWISTLLEREMTHSGSPAESSTHLADRVNYALNRSIEEGGDISPGKSMLLEQIGPPHDDGETHPSNFICPFRIPYFLSLSSRDPKVRHSGCASFRKLNLRVLSKASTIVSTWLLYFEFRSWSRTLWAMMNQG